MKITSGYRFSLILTDTGNVYSWGENNYGQLGIGTVDNYYHSPSKIVFSLGKPIICASAGGYCAAAIDIDHNVYIWGDNNNGRLGLGDNNCRLSPTLIDYFTGKKVEKIFCMSHYICALTVDGKVYCWGDNLYGRLGLSNNIRTAYIPTLVKFPGGASIKKIYLGGYHGFAVDTKSNIYSWGKNEHYQLCNKGCHNGDTPVVADMLTGHNVKKIICLEDSTSVLINNKLYSIGYSQCGALGLNIDKTIKLYRVNFDVDHVINNVYGSSNTLFCKMANGDLYSWGYNNQGQLGICSTESQYRPVKVYTISGNDKIYAGNITTYLISASGKIYTWGINKLVCKDPILTPTLMTFNYV